MASATIRARCGDSFGPGLPPNRTVAATTKMIATSARARRLLRIAALRARRLAALATRSLRRLGELLAGGRSGRALGADGQGRSEVAGTPQAWRAGPLQGCHLCAGPPGASQGGNDTCGLKTCQRGRLSPSSPALEHGLTPEDPIDTLRLWRPERKGFVRECPNRRTSARRVGGCVRTSEGTDGRNAR